jgi:hypothetical protein
MHWITPPPRIPPSIRSRAVLYGNRWLSWWASHRRPSRFPFILAHPSPRGNQQSVSILGIGDDDVVYLFIIYCLFTIYLSIHPSHCIYCIDTAFYLSIILFLSLAGETSFSLSASISLRAGPGQWTSLRRASRLPLNLTIKSSRSIKRLGSAGLTFFILRGILRFLFPSSGPPRSLLICHTRRY